MSNAEKYLLQVVKKNSKKFDDLRYEEYRFDRKLIFELSPTSSSIRLHILRAFDVINEELNILNSSYECLNTEYFGYEMDEGILEPKKFLFYIHPSTLPVVTVKLVNQSIVFANPEDLINLLK